MHRGLSARLALVSQKTFRTCCHFSNESSGLYGLNMNPQYWRVSERDFLQCLSEKNLSEKIKLQLKLCVWYTGTFLLSQCECGFSFSLYFQVIGLKVNKTVNSPRSGNGDPISELFQKTSRPKKKFKKGASWLQHLRGLLCFGKNRTKTMKCYIKTNHKNTARLTRFAAKKQQKLCLP